MTPDKPSRAESGVEWSGVERDYRCHIHNNDGCSFFASHVRILSRTLNVARLALRVSVRSRTVNRH